MQEDLALGGAVLAEFLESDIVVLGVPMYNFTVPSQLKSWVDRILVAGRTFRYTDHGPEGLAGGKRVVLALSRGGFYGPGAPAAPYEHQESYLRAALGFIGLPAPAGGDRRRGRRHRRRAAPEGARRGAAAGGRAPGGLNRDPATSGILIMRSGLSSSACVRGPTAS